MGINMKIFLFCVFISICHINLVVGKIIATPRHRHIRYKRQEVADIEGCKHKMCEDVQNYPSDQIEEILKKDTVLHSYFGNVVAPVNGTSLETRFGDSEEPERQALCKTTDITVIPKLMKDIENKKRYIANVGNFVQAVKFQECNGDKCYGKTLLNHETKCEQKYHTIKLLTVDPENKKPEYASFQIPSTCVCTYRKKTFD